MKEYTTEQRKQLLSFLKEHCDQQFSIEEIAEQLCDGKNISISAVYRNMNKLVAEGAAARFAREGSRKFLYQYVGDRDCKDHLHLKCVKCGQIFHMDGESMEAVLGSVRRNHFEVDKKSTILYGSCDTCK